VSLRGIAQEFSVGRQTLQNQLNGMQPRNKDVTVERVTKWFKDLKWIIEERNIGIQNIYNMNQSGFAIGDIEALRRIINAEIR
jgi:hypothetical protein